MRSAPGAAAAVARAGGAAVEDVLHGQVDVDPLRLPRDLDAVAERADGAVRPAGAAVCGAIASAPHSQHEGGRERRGEGGGTDIDRGRQTEREAERERDRGRGREPACAVSGAYTVGCAG